ncbi:MAG: hypothetical protein Q9166_006081 [cf. Caloplaca sp. 2 TL-2023]
MSGNWAEGKTGVVNLPDDDPKVFEVFSDWLYGERLELDPVQAGDIAFILAIWIFGDKVQAPAFQNAAIEALRAAAMNPPRSFKLKDIQTAFENTAEGSPLQKLIVDLYVWECPLGGLMAKFIHEDYPQAFIIQFADGYFQNFQRPAPKTVKTNRPYNQHAQHYYVPFPGISVGREGGNDTSVD